MTMVNKSLSDWLDGSLIDRRNRQRRRMAWRSAEVHFCLGDGQPVVYVWSLNGQRRDLTPEIRFNAWKRSAEGGEEWRAERQRIQAAANKARPMPQRAIPTQRRRQRKQSMPLLKVARLFQGNAGSRK